MIIRTLAVAGLLGIAGLSHSPPISADRIGELAPLQEGTAIDSAVLWPNGKVYFVRGSTYWQYDIATDRVDPGFPRPVSSLWPGLEGPFEGAVAWPNGKAYFFQVDRYYRFDIEADRVDAGFPRLIQDGWRGLAASGQSFVAAFVWPKLVEGRQKAYFFHRSIYYRYDVLNDSVDPGFPKPITGNWPGL